MGATPAVSTPARHGWQRQGFPIHQAPHTTAPIGRVGLAPAAARVLRPFFDLERDSNPRQVFDEKTALPLSYPKSWWVIRESNPARRGGIPTSPVSTVSSGAACSWPTDKSPGHCTGGAGACPNPAPVSVRLQRKMCGLHCHGCPRQCSRDPLGRRAASQVCTSARMLRPASKKSS